MPAFQVRREVFVGDFTRGPEGFRSVLRYTEALPEALERSLFASRPEGYEGIKLWWGVPPSGLGSWTYMAIVRSGSGHPITPTDGTIILGMTTRGDNDVPGSFVDTNLVPGHWYYYTLMFRVGTRWYPVQKTQSVIPINYDHGQHMFDELPPYYQELDAQQWGGTSNSILERFFDTIGYDLDLTRTLAEGLDKLYDPDSAPLPLYEAMGRQNFGFEPNDALGGIRYRSIVAASRLITDQRGTLAGLAGYLEAATQYETFAANGANLLLLGDDASFKTGTGNWCWSPYAVNEVVNGFHLPLPDQDDHLRTRQLRIERWDPDLFDTVTAPPVLPNELTQSVNPIETMIMVDPNGGQLALACGAGQKRTVVGVRESTGRKYTKLRHLNPSFRGVPVEEGVNYYFSFYMSRSVGNIEEDRVEWGMAYFDRDPDRPGFSDAFRHADDGNGFRTYCSVDPVEIDTLFALGDEADWRRYTITSTVPEGARFLVPIVWVHDRTGQAIETPRFVTAAMVTRQQGIGIEAVYRPGIHLIISSTDPEQYIGLESGKVIGEPRL